MEKQRMSLDEASVNMAALAVDRTRELIQDGWVKGALTAGFDSAEQFCVHGALNLSLVELFGGQTCPTGRVNVCGGYAAEDLGQGPVEALAAAFIVDEAKTVFAFQGGSELGNMGAAPFNDHPDTKHEDVLAVLDGASRRLWAIALGTDEVSEQSWVDDSEVSSEQAQQFLYCQLAA